METIDKLQANISSQRDIDNVWLDVKNIFLSQLSKLPDLPSFSGPKSKRTFRKSQPFWNDELQFIWGELCKAEKEYVNSNFCRMYCNLAHIL